MWIGTDLQLLRGYPVIAESVGADADSQHQDQREDRAAPSRAAGNTSIEFHYLLNALSINGE
jgi:hypothetical protein